MLELATIRYLKSNNVESSLLTIQTFFIFSNLAMAKKYVHNLHDVEKIPVKPFWSTFKGQLISKGLFDVIVSTKKKQQFFLRISALGSKKRPDQKNKGTLYY